MKNFFETPEVEFVKFAVADVVTTSGDGGYVPGENEGDIDFDN